MNTDDRSRAAQILAAAAVLFGIVALALISRDDKRIANKTSTPPGEFNDPRGWLADDQYKFPAQLRKEGFQVTYGTQVAMAVEAFKLVGFANGGAAVALLAFVGAVAKAGSPAPGVVWPLIVFAGGLAFCMGALFASYWAQRCILKYNTMGDRYWRARHIFWYWTAVVFTFFSMVCFVSGIYLAGTTIAAFGNQPSLR